MKCPKCKKDMIPMYSGSRHIKRDIKGWFCFNEKCMFCGIERVDKDYFLDV